MDSYKGNSNDWIQEFIVEPRSATLISLPQYAGNYKYVSAGAYNSAGTYVGFGNVSNVQTVSRTITIAGTVVERKNWANINYGSTWDAPIRTTIDLRILAR